MHTKAELSDLRKKSGDELESYLIDLNNQIADLRAKAEEAHAVYDEVRAEEAAEAAIARLSDPERAALAQYIETKGTPSEAKLGVPGRLPEASEDEG